MSIQVACVSTEVVLLASWRLERGKNVPKRKSGDDGIGLSLARYRTYLVPGTCYPARTPQKSAVYCRTAVTKTHTWHAFGRCYTQPLSLKGRQVYLTTSFFPSWGPLFCSFPLSHSFSLRFISLPPVPVFFLSRERARRRRPCCWVRVRESRGTCARAM